MKLVEKLACDYICYSHGHPFEPFAYNLDNKAHLKAYRNIRSSNIIPLASALEECLLWQPGVLKRLFTNGGRDE